METTTSLKNAVTYLSKLLKCTWICRIKTLCCISDEFKTLTDFIKHKIWIPTAMHGIQIHYLSYISDKLTFLSSK